MKLELDTTTVHDSMCPAACAQPGHSLQFADSLKRSLSVYLPRRTVSTQ